MDFLRVMRDGIWTQTHCIYDWISLLLHIHTLSTIFASFDCAQNWAWTYWRYTAGSPLCRRCTAACEGVAGVSSRDQSGSFAYSIHGEAITRFLCTIWHTWSNVYDIYPSPKPETVGLLSVVRFPADHIGVSTVASVCFDTAWDRSHPLSIHAELHTRHRDTDIADWYVEGDRWDRCR